jgi:phage-related protein
MLKLLGASTLPKFARGVTNFVGGAALVGEKGAELVTLPRGSNVLPANQTKNVLNNSGGNKTYNVNVTTGSGNATEIALQIQREMARSAALSM